MYKQSENLSAHTGGPDLFSELRLWASVLELAVRDYFMGNDELMWDATRWIFEPCPDLQFNTFENLCYTLDLDPDAVRDRLKSMNAAMHERYMHDFRGKKRAFASK